MPEQKGIIGRSKHPFMKGGPMRPHPFQRDGMGSVEEPIVCDRRIKPETKPEEEKFFVENIGDKKEVTVYEVSKISVEEFRQMIVREFPGQKLENLKMTFGIVSCAVSKK